MEVFALLGEFDMAGSVLLGVYASEDEARNAHGVYTRDGDRFIDAYYIERRTIGAPVDSEEYRNYIG
jgi:hypothetical protein